MNSQDLDTVESMISPSAQVQTPIGSFVGNKAYREWIAMHFQAFPDFTHEIRGLSLVSEQDQTLAFELHASGTHAGPLPLETGVLAPTGKRYFMDKTPANALVLPCLAKLYPQAKYVVLTRHPLAIFSSFANSFFDGSWARAHEFNPIVERYVPAMAKFLREQPAPATHVIYEDLVVDPAAHLARVFDFLGLENEPEALFAHRCDWQGSTVLAVHNLSGAPVRAEIDLGEAVTGVDDLLEPRAHVVERGRLKVELAAYGHLWLRTRSSR